MTMAMVRVVMAWTWGEFLIAMAMMQLFHRHGYGAGLHHHDQGRWPESPVCWQGNKNNKDCIR